MNENIGIFNWFTKDAEYFKKLTDREVGIIVLNTILESQKRNFRNEWSSSPITIDQFIELFDLQQGGQIEQIGASVKEGELNEDNIDNTASALLYRLNGKLPENAGDVVFSMIGVSVQDYILDVSNFTDQVLVQTAKDVKVGYEKYIPWIIGGAVVITGLIVISQISTSRSIIRSITRG